MSVTAQKPTTKSWTTLVPAVGIFGLMPLVWVAPIIDPVFLPQHLLLALLVGISWGLGWKKSLPFSLPKLPMLALTALVFCFALSAVQAINLPLAVFETLRWAVFGLLLLFLHQQIRHNPSFFPFVLKTLVVGSLLQATVGWWDWLPYVDGNPIHGLPVGTHANSNLLGLAFLFSLPFLVLGALRFKGTWQILAGLSSLVSLAMVYQSGSRAAAATLLLATLLLTLFWAVRSIKRFKGKGFWLALLAIPVLGLAWFGYDYTFKQKEGTERFSLFWEDTSVMPRQANSLEHRMILWNRTMQMIEDHPVSGVGAANWKLNIQAYGFQSYDARGVYAMDIPQRAHNHFLEILAETGPIGLLAFVSLLVLAILGSRKLMRQGDLNRFQEGFAMLFLGLAFLFAFLFNFPLERPFHLSIFALALALAFSGFDRATHLPPRLFRVVGLGILAFFVGLCGVKMKGETQFKQAAQLKANASWESLFAYSQTLSPTWQPIAPSSGLPIAWYEGMAALILEKKEKGLAALERAAAVTPYHYAVRSNLPVAHNLNGDVQQAIRFYLRLLDDFPDAEEPRLNLAVTYFQAENYEACQRHLNKIVFLKDDPRYIAMVEQLSSLNP